MSRNLRHIAILVSILIFSCVIGTVIYFQEAELPQSGTLTHLKTSEPAEVIIDKDGYFHLYAQSSHDLYIILGYMHATRYLVNMDLFLRAANGTLSEVFGSEHLEIDILSRTIGFSDIASDFVNRVDPDVLQILSAYCDGINTYIDQNSYHLPRDFKLRRYKPSHWKPADCLAIQRLLAWSLSNQLTKKVVFYKLLEIYGQEKTREGFPAVDNLPPGSFPIYNTQLFPDLNHLVNSHLHLLDLLNITVEDLENSWVLSADRTIDNVPALGGELPGFLNKYHDIVELTAPGINIGGLTIPGIPFILAGCNSTIAWNITIRPSDNMEFILNPVSDDNSQYKLNNQWSDFNTRQEFIVIRNATDTTITVRQTALGPVVNLNHKNRHNQYAISVHWNGCQFSDDLKSCTQLYSAKNWEAFKKAVRLHVTPSAEVDFLDINNNIGTAQYVSDLEINESAGRIQTLSRLYEPDFINPVHHLFRNLNPESGYIRHHRVFSKFIQDSSTCKDVFLSDSLLSFQDILTINTDRRAEMLLPLIFETISTKDLSNPVHCRALEILSQWDCRASDLNPAKSIFNSLLNKLSEFTYKDEMDLSDPQLYSQFEHLSDESFLNILYLIQQGGSSWFDDIRTTDIVERRKAVVLNAFSETVDYLTEQYSSNISQWAPENILPSDQINRINFQITLIPRPTIYEFSIMVQQSHLLSHEQKIIRSQSQMQLCNRYKIIQEGARIITILSE